MANRPFTILQLISGNGLGGADRLAIDIAKGLKHRGHQVFWGCPSNCIFINEARAAGLDLFMLDYSGKRDFSHISYLLDFCRKNMVDIVNVHHSHGRHLLIGARLRGLKAKAVVTRHCISGSTPFVSAFFYNPVLDMNIAVSETVRQSLLRVGMWKKKVTTIYGGIDIDRFKNVPSDKVETLRKDLPFNSPFMIGIVGRLCLARGRRTDKPTLKRHEILFNALSMVKEDFLVLVIGMHTHEDMESLNVIAQDNGLDPARIKYYLFQDDIAPFYKIMDLNVMPAPAEGLGLTLIEGMAAGVAGIGANGGGIREIITDGINGFLFHPEDSGDLAHKITTMIGNKELRDLFIRNGEKRVSEQFNIEKTVSETEKLFYDLMGG